jgi:hypothetical protein
MITIHVWGSKGMISKVRISSYSLLKQRQRSAAYLVYWSGKYRVIEWQDPLLKRITDSHGSVW